MNHTVEFEADRQRLLRLATRVLQDRAEAEDIVQQAWLRLDRTTESITNFPGWLTTVTTRLCLDRLRARIAQPAEPTEEVAPDPGPDHELELADSVGVALHMVLDRLSPAERVAFVMHDSFGFEFATIAEALDVTPAAAPSHGSTAVRQW